MEIKKLQEQDEELLLEMSALRKSDYNLPVNIWIDDIGIERKTKHNEPRIKIQNNTADTLQSKDLVSVSINTGEILSGDLKLKFDDFKLIKDFILNNKELLLKYWNREISLRELLISLK